MLQLETVSKHMISKSRTGKVSHGHAIQNESVLCSVRQLKTYKITNKYYTTIWNKDDGVNLRADKKVQAAGMANDEWTVTEKSQKTKYRRNQNVKNRDQDHKQTRTDVHGEHNCTKKTNTRINQQQSLKHE